MNSDNIMVINEEVIHADNKIIWTDKTDLINLINKSTLNKRKRIRLCTHNDIDDKTHEMLIIHTRNTYVRPHKHLNKSESLHVVEGIADMVIYEDNGNISEVFRIGDYNSGNKFYCRISEPSYHNIFIRSDYFIFHEVTGGPFLKSETVFAPWSPDEGDCMATEEFKSKILKDIMKNVKEI